MEERRITEQVLVKENNMNMVRLEEKLLCLSIGSEPRSRLSYRGRDSCSCSLGERESSCSWRVENKNSLERGQFG